MVALFNRFVGHGLAAPALLVLLATLANEPRPAIGAIIGPTDDRVLIFEDADKLGWSSDEIEFAARAVGIIDCTDANGTTRRATFGSIGVTGMMTTTASILSGAVRCEARRHTDRAPQGLPFPSGRQILGSTEAVPAAADDFAVLDLPNMPGTTTYPIDPTGLLATTSSVFYLVSAASSDWDNLDQPIVQLCRPIVRETALAAVTCDARNMMEGSVLLARNSDGILVAVGMLNRIARADLDTLPAGIDGGVFSLVILVTGAFSQALEDISASLPGSLQTASGLPFAGLKRPPTPAGATLLDSGIPVSFAGVTFMETWEDYFDPSCESLPDDGTRQSAVDRLNDSIAKYPADLLRRFVMDISVCQFLTIDGYQYGGTWDAALSKLYIAIDDASDYELDELERTFHHELSSGFLNDFALPFPRDEWIAATGAYAYTDVPVGETLGKGVEVGLDPRPEFLERGFILPYGVNNLEEDFNTYAEMAMFDPASFRSYAEQYPLVCLKGRILAGFYQEAGVDYIADLLTLNCDAVPLTRDMIVELQTLLAAAGYDPRGIDGLLGAGTRAAVAAAAGQLGVAPDAAVNFGLLGLTRERLGGNGKL